MSGCVLVSGCECERVCDCEWVSSGSEYVCEWVGVST